MQISFNSYMFRHRSAIYMQSTKTNHHLTNTPIPVLIAFIVVIKILEFQNLQNLQTNPESCHTNTCFEFLQVQSGSCLYSVCSRYTNICSLYVIQRYLVLQNCRLQLTGTHCAVYRHWTPSATDTKSCWLQAFCVIKEDLFPSLGDKAGNFPTCNDHIKKTFCSVAGHREDVQVDCHIFGNTSPYEIFWIGMWYSSV